MKADLHIHSRVSDGSDTIWEIIENAKIKGLDAISITDHDTTAHWEKMPENPGIQVVRGIEISAVHRGTNTRAHVLGYNIQQPEIISALTQPLLEARSLNSEKQVDILIRNGYNIERESLARADGKYLYKQHIMEFLVSTGQAPDMFGEFYQKTFKNKGICAFDIEYIDVFDAVKTIKQAGGVAVLAHPGQQKNFWLIPELTQLGLDGLELNHPANSLEDKETIREMAAEYGLFLTGGSDYHGKYEGQPFMVGDFLSDESGAKAICKP